MRAKYIHMHAEFDERFKCQILFLVHITSFNFVICQQSYRTKHAIQNQLVAFAAGMSLVCTDGGNSSRFMGKQTSCCSKYIPCALMGADEVASGGLGSGTGCAAWSCAGSGSGALLFAARLLAPPPMVRASFEPVSENVF
jgi:hypothetical protein